LDNQTKIKYKVEHRDVKHPRLEFKDTTLLIILPHEIKDPKEILERRKNWIKKKWKIIQEATKDIEKPEGFTILGEHYKIENTNTPKPIIDHKEKTIKIDKNNKKHIKIIKQKLRKTPKQKINEIIEKYSEKIGTKPNKIIIREQKTKWGSCSNKKNISLNLKLICLPTELIKYITLHELLHLKEKRHTPAFKEIMKKEFPNHKEIEKKLLKYWFYTEKLLNNLEDINS